MPIDGNALKLIPFNAHGMKKIISVGWYDCEIKIISAESLEYEM